MPQTTLTDIALRALKDPEAGQVDYWDNSLRGFGIRVSQGGSKTFVAFFGVPRQRVTIGRYPTITLADARAEAKRIFAEHTLGKHRPKSIAWEDAQKAYLAECKQRVENQDLKARTLLDYTRLLNKYFAFGRRQLSDTTADDVTRRLNRTEAPSERNHALVAVKIFLCWAQRPPRRYIAHNPCEGMSPTKRPSRKRVLSDTELGAIYRTALSGVDAYSKIVALLILTGQRRCEIGGLRREWIAAEQRTITFPSTITKNKSEHTIPIGRTAQSILKKMHNQGNYLFPATREHVGGKPTTTYNGWGKDKEAFDEACGVSGWKLLDVRRTVATKLAESKVAPHVIERLLNHKFGSIQNQIEPSVSAVAEVYNRYLYLDEMRAALAVWERRLTALARTA